MSDRGLLDILNKLTLSTSATQQTAGELSDTLHGGSAECPVCMEQMFEPTILTACGHTFCRSCLKEMSRREGKTIRCPMDRQPCVLPSDGVDGLPINFALRDIIGEGSYVTEYPESLHSSRECSECHSTAILRPCRHCGEHICKECIALHRDMNTEQLRQLSRQLRDVRGRCEKSLTQRRSLLEEQPKIFDGVREEVSDFTTTFQSKLIEIVAKLKLRLVAEITKHQRLFEEKIGIQIEHLEADERYVNECKTRIDSILNYASISVSKSQIRALDKGTSEILQKGTHEVTPNRTEYHFLIPCKDQQDGVYQQVARLFDVERLTSDLSSDKKDAGKLHSACNTEPGQRRPTLPGQADRDVGRSSVASVRWSVLRTGRSLGAGVFNWPLGVAVSHATRTICVADYRYHCLQWFNYNASCIRTVGDTGGAPGQFRCPTGVACTPDGHFVISDKENHRVQVLDSSGAVVRLLGKRGSGDGCFKSPQGIALDSSTGNIYVCDSCNHRVQVLRANGEFIGTFGFKGASDGQFDRPVGIAVAQGRVVVTDYSNRLQVFTTAGEHTRTISSEHVLVPWGVVFNQAGNKVYVCCKTNIVVYQLSPTVELVKHIPSPVAGKRPQWIALLSESEALVTMAGVNVAHRMNI